LKCFEVDQCSDVYQDIRQFVQETGVVDTVMGKDIVFDEILKLIDHYQARGEKISLEGRGRQSRALASELDSREISQFFQLMRSTFDSSILITHRDMQLLVTWENKGELCSCKSRAILLNTEILAAIVLSQLLHKQIKY